MDFDSKIFDIICSLYNNFRFARKDVQFIIDIMRNFIKDYYNPELHKILQANLLNSISKEVTTEITST